MSEQYDLLKSILLEKSVRTGTFTLASGKVSDLYVDCRMTALDPVGATLVGALGWKLVKEDILPRFPEVAAIGGITLDNAPALVAAGADLLAVISDVFSAPDPAARAAAYAGLFD